MQEIAFNLKHWFYWKLPNQIATIYFSSYVMSTIIDTLRCPSNAIQALCRLAFLYKTR